ncbi:MAG: hypothetical protein Q9194_006459 [Teloschistes cf. exilis]
MDISSLLDSDASGPTKPPSPPSDVKKEHNQPFRSPQQLHQGHYHGRAPDYQQHRDNRPPQPPPLRPPPHNEFRSSSISSYSSAQSPYQRTPSSSALSTSQYPFPQPSLHNPANSGQTQQYYQHESQSIGGNRPQIEHGQPGSLPQTPTSATISSSFPSYQHQRPPSAHSASTPTSGHTQTPTFLNSSPQQPHAQVRGTYIPNPNYQYSSQPGTPLGPPTSLGRQGSSLRRESPCSYDHRRSNSGSSHGPQQQIVQSPNTTLRDAITSPQSASASIHARPVSRHSSGFGPDREQSMSVSPKTRLPQRLPNMREAGVYADSSQTANEQIMSAKRKRGDSIVDETSQTQQSSVKRTMSIGVAGILNESHDEPSKEIDDSQGFQNQYPQVTCYDQTSHERLSMDDSPAQTRGPTISAPASSAVQEKSNSNPATESSISSRLSPLSHDSAEMSASAEKARARKGVKYQKLTHSPQENLNSDMASETAAPNPPTTNPPTTSPPTANTKPRIRFREVPIWAQSARKRPIQNPFAPATQTGQSNIPQQQHATSILSVGHGSNGQGRPADHSARSELDPTGILGLWEPSITNVIPAEELSKAISDYLFTTVVNMNGVQFGPAGGTASHGAMVEVEAKIGQIIDKNTNDRIRIPVSTECMLSRNDPNLRTAFRSSMTETQHRRLNGFLNQALKDSQPQPPGESSRKPRVPLSYVHTRETDTFYDLSDKSISSLPPSVQQYLDRRNRPKLRITTDQKTGKEIAKIVKVRISDIEIYSPQTVFDWRVSVSLEVNYDGDVRDLVESTEGKDRRRPDRNKDRVSYKHSHYQIDLTQVKPADTNSKTEKEHELEVELSSQAIREQGLLAMQGQENKYLDLIKGFVDNVRTLARHCKEG